jgi:hypothetical protein
MASRHTLAANTPRPDRKVKGPSTAPLKYMASRTRSRQPGADCTGHTGQTFRRPSGTRQRAALWRWLVCNLIGSHVSPRVVSASASSSRSCVRTPNGDRVQTPTALLGRIPCGAARVGGVVLCPEWVPRCDWHVLPSPRAVGWSRPEVQLTRKGC